MDSIQQVGKFTAYGVYEKNFKKFYIKGKLPEKWHKLYEANKLEVPEVVKFTVSDETQFMGNTNEVHTALTSRFRIPSRPMRMVATPKLWEFKGKRGIWWKLHAVKLYEPAKPVPVQMEESDDE